MKKLSTALCLFFCLTAALSACSTTQSAGDPPEYFAKLTESQADEQLKQVNSDIEELDKEIRGAEQRRDNARMKQGSDASKDADVEGSEASLDSLQMKKGALITRQILLQRRLRELNGPAY